LTIPLARSFAAPRQHGEFFLAADEGC
jgi:hypothetical protein